MKQPDMVALLGRPLTSLESSNFTVYLDVAYELLADVLCYDPCSKAQERAFKAREGYSTVFVGAFSYVSSVEVNGTAVSATPQLWDNLNAKWYNSLVFPHKLKRGDTVTVTAQWGFSKMPSDLKMLLSKYFVLASSGTKNEQNIQSKRVEDFSITYANADKTKAEQIATANYSTISKYSICNIGNLQHGKTCNLHRVYGCGYCF